MEYYLREVYICNRIHYHIECADPDVALLVVNESVEVAVNLDARIVGSEERFRSPEGACVAWCIEARPVHGLVGISHDGVEGGLFVEDKALHAVEGDDLVPDEDVPEAPVELVLIVCALERRRCYDLGVWCVGHVVCEVAAQVEDGGHCISQFSEHLGVVLIPVIEPFCLPVVAYVEHHLIVPEHFEVEIYDWHIEVDVLRLVEVQFWFSHTACQQDEE